MLLIEAARISDGGGGNLLRYLVSRLLHRRADFRIVLRSGFEIRGLPETMVRRRSVNLTNRQKCYREWMVEFNPSTVLCFGNFGPPMKLPPDVRVVTYFHRLNLLPRDNDQDLSFKSKFKYWTLRRYLSYTLPNTDRIFVQSEDVQQGLISAFGLNDSRVEVFPFYDSGKIKQIYKATDLKGSRKVPDRFIYVSSYAPHKNHATLLDAWDLLADGGCHPELQLTLPANSPFKERLKLMDELGIRINNLGFNSVEATLKYTAQAAFAIYPSTVESLGLGLVEAASLGCRILAADLPYTYQAIKPSLVFDPESAESIANAVRCALYGDEPLPVASLVMHDQVEEMIDRLTIG